MKYAPEDGESISAQRLELFQKRASIKQMMIRVAITTLIRFVYPRHRGFGKEGGAFVG